ncbi:aryl-sulfate sulfotransferase [Nocardioides sp. LS1]|uniref:aryl-sulfate sulfotransferase n=1 Tax=Nocardioides sp. LS1 TaxID=1027620 RepID=UPI000F624691|nr:aryl-sulfate sulfotransferase [Nocardioides sp. LS1]GCD89459.1 hypothetical protein NLS1_14650 [Nocardioides sp. LS1]
MQWRPGVLVAAVAVTALQLLALTAPTQAADAPAHSVTIEGAGVSTWPSYDAGTDRYAVHTDDTTDGTLTVTAGTTDTDGTITVNGIPATNGQPLTLTDLVPGDEVAVAIADSAGTSHQSWIYLPTGFPTITSAGTGSPGHVLVGLSSFLSAHSFEAVLDNHGVPTHVREAPEPNDFTPQRYGPAYTVFEPVKDGPDDTPSEYGYRVRELDASFHETGTRRLAPVPELGITAHDTDFHDVQYLPDGRVVLVGYHRSTYDDGKQWLDAVIQIQDAAGHATFTWTSKGHADPSEGYVLGGKGQDYAHINSVQVLAGGDLLASFRNLGQVMRIATGAHDGFAPGDVIWKMGGQDGDFTFLDDPYAGFCAQHDARILPNGHLLLFDNGSRKDTSGPVAPQTANMCPDPANPTGARIARPQTRVVEYALDEAAHTATRVWSFEKPGRYAAFAGNAQRLWDGTTVVGWSASQDSTGDTPPFVSEVTTDGNESWSLTAPGWFSYRAFRAPPSVIGDPVWRPDLKIRKAGGTWQNGHVQVRLVHPGDEATFHVRLRNRSSTFAYAVQAGSDSKAFRVRYFHGGHDITHELTKRDVVTPELDQGQTWTIRVVVHRTKAVSRGKHIAFQVYASGGMAADAVTALAVTR